MITETDKIVRELKMVQNFLFKILEQDTQINKQLKEIKDDIHSNWVKCNGNCSKGKLYEGQPTVSATDADNGQH